MTTVIIDESNPQGQWLLDLIKDHHSVSIVGKKSFRQAAEECNAITVDEFFDELDRRIEKRFRHA